MLHLQYTLCYARRMNIILSSQKTLSSEVSVTSGPIYNHAQTNSVWLVPFQNKSGPPSDHSIKIEQSNGLRKH